MPRLTLPSNEQPVPNEHFISFLVRDSAPLTRTSHNMSLEGSINGKPVTYLIDTGANVSAIRANVWDEIPPRTKHPPSPTHVTSIAAVNSQGIPVLGQVELPY